MNIGGKYKGQDRYEARKNVIADLEKGGFMVGTEPYAHNVGQCYRCKTDIEPMVSKQWFVKIKPLAKPRPSPPLPRKKQESFPPPGKPLILTG